MMLKIDKEKAKRWGFLIFIIIPVLIYIPYYLKGEIPGNTDLVQFFSSRIQFAQSLLNGEIMEWNRYLAGGMPQAMNGYIPNILLSLFPLKQYIYLFFIFHLFIGSFFFYLYMKENGCSYRVSMVMGIIYECSIQINGLRKTHANVIVSICLFPVIMFLVKRFFNTGKSWWLYLSAVAAAMQAMNMQQYSVYADLILFIYIVIFCIHEKFGLWDLVKKGAAWLAIYVGIFACVLFPTLSIMNEYSQYGATGISYETFSSWSVHPVKLIQMIIPKFFGEIYMPLGNLYSSELDIELYLGIFVLLLAVSIIVKSRNKMAVRVDLLCAAFAFLYAAVAHIPILNHIVYRLPVLGGFRCAGRMLYIFYFFMFSLAGRGLENLIEGEICEGQRKLIQKMAKTLFVGIICLAVTGIFVICLLNAEGRIQYCYQLKDALSAPMIWSGVIVLVLWAVQKKKLYKWEFTLKWKGYFVCAAVLAITLAEVMPYSLITQPLSLAQLNNENQTVQKLKKTIGNYKIWDALDRVDVSHESIVSWNKSQVNKIPSLNAYTAYNNPLQTKYMKNLGRSSEGVPFNYSGLLTGSHNAYNNLLFQNDLLSMMGVKYVIDSSGIIESTGGNIYNSDCETNLIISKENVDLAFDANGVGVGEVMSGVQGNTCYKVTFSVRGEDNRELSYLAADLYGGEGYDLGSQEKSFFISEDGNEYTAYLFSDHAEQAAEDIRIRILAKSATGKAHIDKCEISVVSPMNGYKYWGSDERGTKIYENVNAKDILYFPNRVVEKNSFDDMYDNYEKYDLAKTAYVGREGGEYENVSSDVKVLSYESNSITAKVTSDADTYLCFSQNHSTHWSVEVDGAGQEVDMVNGLIMGTRIPAGEHTVTFYYHDNASIVGICITGATIIILVCCYILGRRKSRHKS